MHSSLQSLDYAKLESLIESSFGKKLAPGYGGYVRPSYVCIAESDGEYAGAAIVEEFMPGMFYLDKLAVAPEHRGNGVAKSLWSIIGENSDKIAWRAKPENPINAFYSRKSSGSTGIGGWIVYWKGMGGAEIQAAIAYALAKKPTLEERDAEKALTDFGNQPISLSLP